MVRRFALQLFIHLLLTVAANNVRRDACSSARIPMGVPPDKIGQGVTIDWVFPITVHLPLQRWDVFFNKLVKGSIHARVGFNLICRDVA